MKTLLFCTAYFDTGIQRYIDWVNYYKEKLPNCEMLILHDGPINIELKNKLFKETNNYIGEKNLKDFPDKLLHQHPIFPSWWRSFLHGLREGKNDFNKIIHIESDAFVLSQRLLDYINNTNHGWVALFSQKYGFPESAIQIINEDSFYRIDKMPEMHDFVKIVEFVLPYTHVEKSFIGDRYGEDGKLPKHEIDYACQWNLDWYIPEDFIKK